MPLLVNGVEPNAVVVNGVQADTVVCNGVECWSAYSPVPGVTITPGLYVSNGWNNLFNMQYCLLVDADGVTGWAQQQVGYANPHKAPNPTSTVTEVNGRFGNGVESVSPPFNPSDGDVYCGFRFDATGPSCMFFQRGISSGWSPPLTWSDATGFTLASVSTPVGGYDQTMTLRRNLNNFRQFRIEGNLGFVDPSAWITCTPP